MPLAPRWAMTRGLEDVIQLMSWSKSASRLRTAALCRKVVRTNKWNKLQWLFPMVCAFATTGTQLALFHVPSHLHCRTLYIVISSLTRLRWPQCLSAKDWIDFVLITRESHWHILATFHSCSGSRVATVSTSRTARPIRFCTSIVVICAAVTVLCFPLQWWVFTHSRTFLLASCWVQSVLFFWRWCCASQADHCLVGAQPQWGPSEARKQEKITRQNRLGGIGVRLEMHSSQFFIAAVHTSGAWQYLPNWASASPTVHKSLTFFALQHSSQNKYLKSQCRQRHNYHQVQRVQAKGGLHTAARVSRIDQLQCSPVGGRKVCESAIYSCFWKWQVLVVGLHVILHVQLIISEE